MYVNSVEAGEQERNRREAHKSDHQLALDAELENTVDIDTHRKPLRA